MDTWEELRTFRFGSFVQPVFLRKISYLLFFNALFLVFTAALPREIPLSAL